MAASGTYEQHVFGLELQAKWLGPLAKSVALLEKNANAWDKFEARVQGGGLNKAMSKVNGLIARFQELEKVMDRAGMKSRIYGGGGGAAGGGGSARSGSVMNSHDARRKYEVWWESQIKKQESADERAAARKQREFDRLRLDQQKAMERADKQQQAAMKPFADMWGKIGMKMHQQQFEAAKKKSGELREDIGKIGGYLKEAIGILASGIRSVLSVGLEYGTKLVHTIVDAAKERGLLMTAYEVQLGSRGKAEKQLQKTLDIAQLTPASNLQVVDTTKKLMGAQFQGRRLDAARAAWADVQAFGGDNAARQIQFWMSRVAARGEASTAGVSGIAKAGISERFIREEMAKQLGKSVGYKEGDVYSDKTDKAVRDAISDRKVSSGMFETAVERAVLRTLKQTQLGAYSKKKGAESLAGVLSNIEEAVPTFLMRLNVDEFAGIKELKRFLGDLLSFFSLGTKEGREFAKIIEEFTNELLGGLKNISRDDMSRFFYQAAEAARTLVTVIGEAWTKLDELIKGSQGKDFGTLVGDVGKLLGEAFGQALAAAMPVIMESAAKAVPGAVAGVAKGAWKIGEGWGHSAYWAANRAANWVEDKAGGTALGKAAAAKEKRMQEAPVVRASEIDNDTATIEIPRMAKGGIVRRPTVALIGERGPEEVGPVGGRGGGASVYIEQLIIQCDESAMRSRFDEWILETLDDELAGGAVS